PERWARLSTLACARTDLGNGDAFQTWRGIAKRDDTRTTFRRPAMYVTHQAFLSHDSKRGSPKSRRSGSPAPCGRRKPETGAPTWSYQVQKSRVNGIGGAFSI